YLCHWQIYPAWENTLPWFATALSLAAGVALWWCYGRAADAVTRAARFVRSEIREDPRGLNPWRYLTRDETPLPGSGPAR
ncbi:MAG TPA: hypothetical protein VD813_13860, partial [Pseudonocardia sp.]|nr:hypothetical protein [Pseudonocardia sp.]